MGKVGCDIWEKWVGVGETQKHRLKCEIWEKWGATYGKNVSTTVVGTQKASMMHATTRRSSSETFGMMLLHKRELNSEIWEKGVCDIWEKWVCLGGEIRLQNKELNTFSKHASGSILATEISASTFGEMGVGRVGGPGAGDGGWGQVEGEKRGRGRGGGG